MFNVTTEELPGVTGFVPKEIVVPAGKVPADSVTGVVYPKMEVTPRVMAAEFCVAHVIDAAAGLSNAKLGTAGTKAKFTFEISKNIFPTASTLMRAVLVVTAGMVTTSVPSLGVLAANTVGKVRPPSVEREIFTLAQLTGARSEPLTNQVMV